MKSIAKTSDGYDITLDTNVPARFVDLDFDGISGFFSDNFFNLIPGSVKTVHFKTNAEITDPERQLKMFA